MRFLEMTIFNPTSSAAINTSPKRYPPRPSFQLHAIVSGYAIIANKMGLEIMRMADIRFQFWIFLIFSIMSHQIKKKANKYQNFTKAKLRAKTAFDFKGSDSGIICNAQDYDGYYSNRYLIVC